MLLVSLIAWIFAFFLPLNIYFEIGLLVVGIVNLSYNFKYFSSEIRKLTYFKSPIFLFFLLVTAVVSSFFPYINDHFGYYIPTIEILNSEGLIKGVSSLHLVLGQQSPWHILQASFDNSIDIYCRLNGFLLIVFLIYIFEKKQYYFLIFIPLFLLFVQSPSPDLPIYIISLILINELLIVKTSSIAFLFLLSVWMVSIKPFAFWMPIFIIIYMLLHRKLQTIFNKNWHYSFLFSSLIIFLFLFKNYWCCSNFLFPLDAFYVDSAWALPKSIITASSKNALLKTYDFQFTFTEIQHFIWTDYFKNFFLLNGFKGVLHIVFLVFSLVFGVYSLFIKNKIFFLIFLLGLAKICIVVLISGQYRFFLDVILVFGFLFIYSIKLNLTFNTIFAIVFSLLALFVFLNPVYLQKNIPSFKIGFIMQNPTLNQIYQPGKYHIESFEQKKFGNLNFNIPNYHLLLDCKTPAITNNSLKEYLKIGYFPQKMGENIKDGFYLKKLSITEKKELKKLILHQ